MIKEILKSLTPEQRKQLLYAFENNIPQYICIDGNRFIGVNVDHINHLIINQTEGVWSIGYLKERMVV